MLKVGVTTYHTKLANLMSFEEIVRSHSCFRFFSNMSSSLAQIIRTST